MINREEARAIAEKEVLETGAGAGIKRVCSFDESSRRPSGYAMPDLTACWIVYLEPPPFFGGVCESSIVAISKESGAVLYRGRAGDEG